MALIHVSQNNNSIYWTHSINWVYWPYIELSDTQIFIYVRGIVVLRGKDRILDLIPPGLLSLLGFCRLQWETGEKAPYGMVSFGTVDLWQPAKLSWQWGQLLCSLCIWYYWNYSEYYTVLVCCNRRSLLSNPVPLLTEIKTITEYICKKFLSTVTMVIFLKRYYNFKKLSNNYFMHK